MKSSHRKNRNS